MIEKRRYLMLCGLLIGAVYLPCSPIEASSSKVDDKDNPEYIWDLTELFKSPKDWNTQRKNVLKQINKLADLKGSFKDADSLQAGLDSYWKVYKDVARVYVYASLQADENLKDAAAQERNQLATGMWAKMDETTAWMQPEILALGESRLMAFFKQQPGLETYRFELENILRNAPHTLNDAAEAALSYFSLPAEAPKNVYDALAYADIPWPTITLASGEKVRLDSAGYSRWRSTDNRADRKKVFDGYWTKWSEYQNSFGMVLNAHIQQQVAQAKARKYDSVLQRELFADNLPKKVYNTLIKEVNKALPTLHRYFRLRSKMLGLDQMHYYDIYPPLVSLEKTFDYETSKKLTLEAMSVLGEDWVSQQKTGMDSRWAHVYPAEGKRSGAYMAGFAYDVHPYLLLNHNDDFESLSTVAHEWGHAMHTLYAKANQPFHKARYSTFIAEIPSTSLELILQEHMLAKASSLDEKLFYLGADLESMRGTLFRQTMFAEFELSLYETVERGEALTGKKMTEMYGKLLKRYHGHKEGVVIINDLYANEWMFIPHFYYNMYVFQYSTSITAGTALYEKIVKEGQAGVDNYKNLLRAGSSDHPYQLLKNAGVDMATGKPYKAIISRMNNTMDQIETLLVEKAKQSP